MAKLSRLPNAPLTEVVFELHWQTFGDLGDHIPSYGDDPRYPEIFDGFSTFARRAGFDHIKDFNYPPYIGVAHTPSRRFYRGEDKPFPLYQIGPGMYAANDSRDYEWKAFKKQILNGAKATHASFPNRKEFPLTITRLEIRYLDSFDEDLIGSTDFVEFVGNATNLGLELPAFLSKRTLFKPQKRVHLQIDSDVKGLANTIFVVDIGSGRKDQVPVIRLDSKVITRGENLLPTGKPDTFIKSLDRWLEKAYKITSPFFKDFVNPTVFDKFK